jgi:L-fucose isomerase-like protein
MSQDMSLGLIVATRGVFNKKLAQEGRAKIVERVKTLGYEPIILPESATPTGAIETLGDAQKCAALFRQNCDKIKGIIVTLPNFGDEIGVANALQLAKLDVPVLVHAEDDDLDQLTVDTRRDAFCGKFAICNNLRQYGIRFTDTTYHSMKVDGEQFGSEVNKFARICAVVDGLRNLRVGAIGTRPAAFQTVRTSEKLLQKYGITVVPVDLSEILGAANALDPDSADVREKSDEIRAYGKIPSRIAKESVARVAKFAIVVERWMKENEVQAAAIQCWSSIQMNYGCSACIPMSMMSERLIPCACEMDVSGAVSSYALTLASGKPVGLLEWNNNYGDDREKCVLQHCSNLPRSFVGKEIELVEPSVLGNSLGMERCFGAVQGKAVAGPFTYFRIATDDPHAKIHAYLGEGELTDDPFEMKGGIAVCRTPRLQALMKHLCKEGFEHHVSVVRSLCADVISEAVGTYLGWDLYVHN